MKIAIHDTTNSFSQEWINYCEEQKIDYKIVNCYRNDIINQLVDCNMLMWHFQQSNPIDYLMAESVLCSLESVGKRVFPNHSTSWHFDDKVSQKYLLESNDIDTPENFVFYSLSDYKRALSKITFPIVWKLKGGSGSRNVKLINSKSELDRVAKKMFGRGVRNYDSLEGIKEALRRFRIGKFKIIDVLKAFAHIIIPIRAEKSNPRSWGYLYLQEFIKNNDSDYRLIVIGDKAFGIKRYVRDNDFRASGSGFIEYKRNAIPEVLVKLSFEHAAKLGMQCIAFDYVFKEDRPLLVEISFGFKRFGYYECEGYWTNDLGWHEGTFNPYGWMVEDLLKANS